MKRFFSVLLAVCMIFSLVPTVFAEKTYGDIDIDVENVLEYGNSDETPDEPGVMPGLNMLTSKSGAVDFESLTEVPSYLTVGGTKSVASNPASDSVNGSSKVLQTKVKASSETYPSVEFTLPEFMEAERPVYVTFMYKKGYEAAASETPVNGSCLWLMRDGGTYIANSIGGFAMNGNWAKFAKLVDFSKATHVTNKTYSTNADLDIIKIQAQALKNDGYTVFYYDNFEYIPSYKATYMLNDGTDEAFTSEYFLFPDNDITKPVLTEYTIRTDLAPARTDYVLAGWSTDENATEPDADGKVALANEDIVLYAVWNKDTSIRKTLKPGLNMAGGQTYAWNFEESADKSMNNMDFFTNSIASEIAENPLKDSVNSSDSVMRLYRSGEGTNYPSSSFNLTEPFETERPIHVSFKYYKTYTPLADEAGAISTNLWVMVNNAGYIAKSIGEYDINAGWKQYSGLVDFTKAFSASNSSVLFKDKVKAIILEGSVPGNDGTTSLYFDDISFIPSYKITYMQNDGSDDAVFADYVLYEDDDVTKPMVTKYTVDDTVEPKERYKYKFLGWSTDKNATTAEKAVTEVALDNEDVVLYAIWEEDTTLPDEVTLKWDFETADTRTWYLNNGGYEVKYENGMYVVDTTNRINTSHIKHPDFTAESEETLNTAALRYLVFNARSTGTDNVIKVYFTTTNSPDYSEDKTVMIPIKASSSVFEEYYIDMTDHDLWTGDYRSCMVQIGGGSGVTEIEEIYFTTNYDIGEKEPIYEYHYNLSSFGDYNWGQTWRTNNGDGTLYTGKSGGPAMDKKGRVILYENADSKTIVGYQKNNADGSVTYYDADNNVVTEAPGVSKGTEGGGFYMPDINTEALDASIYRYLVFEVTGDSTITGLRAYFSTTTSGGYNEARAVNASFTQHSNGKKYCVADCSAVDTYADIIKSFMIVIGGKCTATVTDIYLTNTPPADEVKDVTIEKVYLNASSETITEDHGTVTVSPYIRYTDGSVATDFSDTYYITDSVAAQVKKNDDGTATVTAQMNGEVNITAVFPDGITTLSTTIKITGQAERLAANSFKVMMFGNSIRGHGKAENMGWYGEGWGMAASSKDKDYARRFIYYMNKKYGEGVAELVPCGTPGGFEAAAAACTEYKAEDFVTYVNGFKSHVAAQNPDIVTIQLGENGGGAASAEAYAKIMEQVVRGIWEVNPDIIVVMSTPFWSDDSANKVVGTYAAGKALGIQIAPVNTLGKGAWSAENPYMAFDAPWVTEATTGGVKAHPGDLGMDRIAQMFFEKVNITLSANERTKYTTIPSKIEISCEGDAVITEEYGTLQLSSSVIPSDAAQEVVWSVDNRNIGTVDENGLVTAVNDGTLTVIATSKYMNDIYGTFTVEISGQTTPHTVTYDKNTTDDVSNMPVANNLAKENFVFDAVYPVRSTYKFLGWSLKADGTEADVISTYDVTEDITVYAVWEKAHRWSFERTDYKEEFTVENGFNEYVLNGYFTTIATGTDLEAGVILKINSPVLDLNASDYVSMVLRMRSSEAAKDSAVEMTFNTTDGDVVMTKAIPNGEYNEYVFDLSDVTGKITGFSFKPTNVDTTIYIDEIAFVESYILNYDANTDDETVAGMPAGAYKAVDGKVALSDVVPTRTGYTFLGWAKTADSKLVIEDAVEASLEAPVTVYAIWDKNDHMEFDSEEESGISSYNYTTDKVFENGILSYSATGDHYITPKSSRFGYAASSTSGVLQVRMKWENTDARTAQIFFITDVASISESRSKSVKLEPNAPEDFQTLTFDFTSNADWANNIKSFRFDLLSGVGKNSVDWIRFTNSEANIVTSAEESRLLTYDDWASHIVKKNGVLAVEGGVEIKNLALNGDIDMSKGYLTVTDNIEIADGVEYAVYTLDMEACGITADDEMYISGSAVAVKPVDGAKYIIKTHNGAGYVAFRKNGSSEVTVKLVGEATENDETTFIVAQYNSYRVAYTSIITYADFVDGKVSFTIDEGNSAKLITVASKTKLMPVFEAPVID